VGIELTPCRAWYQGTLSPCTGNPVQYFVPEYQYPSTHQLSVYKYECNSLENQSVKTHQLTRGLERASSCGELNESQK